MIPGQDSWDEDYRQRGSLFGGSAPRIPGLLHSSRILELGCGNGKTASSLVQEGRSVTAIDSSPHAALLCRETCRDPDRAGILVADATRTPFCNESFDVIIASHLAGHLSTEGRSRLAAEIHRLLRSGGIVHFRDFSTRDFRYGRGRETEPGTFTRKNGIATHYFTRDEVMDLFSGFAVIALDQHRWEMRVRGTVYPRAEIVAEWKKTA